MYEKEFAEMSFYSDRQFKKICAFAMAVFLMLFLLAGSISHGMSACSHNRSEAGTHNSDMVDIYSTDLAGARTACAVSVAGNAEVNSLFQHRNSIVSLYSILFVLAAVLFAFTCVILLLFLNDRLKRFLIVQYIHRSDGKIFPCFQS